MDSPFFAVETEILHFSIETNLDESLQKWQEAPETRHQSSDMSRSADRVVATCASRSSRWYGKSQEPFFTAEVIQQLALIRMEICEQQSKAILLHLCASEVHARCLRTTLQKNGNNQNQYGCRYSILYVWTSEESKVRLVLRCGTCCRWLSRLHRIRDKRQQHESCGLKNLGTFLLTVKDGIISFSTHPKEQTT